MRAFAVDQATGEAVSVNNWSSLSYLERWNDNSGGTLNAKDAGGFGSAEWLKVLERPFGSLFVVDEAGLGWSGYPYPSMTEQADTSTTITFASDLSNLDNRLVTPREDPGDWTGYTHRKYAGDARTKLRALIDDFCGPGAFDPVDNLAINPVVPGGPDIAIAARGELSVLGWVTPKGTAARQRITAIWDQTQRNVVVTIEPCEDLSNSVMFAPQLMNLTGWEQTITQPKYDRVVVAGQGEGVNRLVVTLTTGRTGRRHTAFFDRRNIDNLPDLQAEAVELLEAGRGSAQITAQMVDRPEQTYGRDFRLGDLVKVVAAGATFVEPVTEVLTEAKNDGTVTRTVTAGFGALRSEVRPAAALAELSRKVSQIGAT